MSARARLLAQHGLLAGALFGVIVLLSVFHSVVSTAVAHAHANRNLPAAVAALEPPTVAATAAKGRRAALVAAQSGD